MKILLNYALVNYTIIIFINIYGKLIQRKLLYIQ